MKLTKKEPNKKKLLKNLKNSWQLYVFLAPALIYYIVFNYLPMYGIQIAFKDYRIVDGIMGSEWAGLKHFSRFFSTYYFRRLLANTFLLNIYNVLWATPMPLILALLLNQVRSPGRKRFIQTTIYIPHFISGVVMAGMLYLFLAPTNGVFNTALNAMGFKSIDFMLSASWFRTIYITSGIWQGAGYSSILFIATLTSVDPGLYEAAEIDGASVWHKIRHIDIPSVLPTFIMTSILSFGSLLSSNTTKTLLLQTSGNIPTSDIIGVYVYNLGLGTGQFSYTAAIGLFTNVINIVMILVANKAAKKVSSVGLF